MENLSDVEFGSDKSDEEAPILVAQRYLNIFRQVHIFKKEKRDQFDDELLALPQNVTDFFKRMPGGRLHGGQFPAACTAAGCVVGCGNLLPGALLPDAPRRARGG